MDYERFLKKLKEERKGQGISLRELSENLGVTAQYISMWENNRAPLKMKDYFSVCKILEISPINLLQEETTKKEYQYVAEKLKDLSDRDLKIIKDLIILMGLSTEDL